MEEFSLLGGGWLRLHLEQVGGTGGVQALWLRSSSVPAEETSAWRRMTAVAGNVSWELGWESLALLAAHRGF